MFIFTVLPLRAMGLRAMGCRFLAGAACFAVLGSGAYAADDSLTPLTQDRLTVGWTAENGLTVAIDGVPFVRRSSLVLVKPGWSGVILNQPQIKPRISNWTLAPDGSKNAKITLENADAACEYSLSVSPTNRVTVDLAYRLKRDIAAEIEYAAGYLSGPLLQGAGVQNYTASADGASAAGVPSRITLAPPAPGRSQEQNRLGPPLKSVTFETRLGAVSVDYSGTAPAPILFDGRSDSADWATEFPLFWLGIGSPSPSVAFRDGARHAALTFRVLPAAPVSAVTIPVPVATAESVTAAYVPTLPAQPLILPRPKVINVRAGASGLRLSSATRIVLIDKSPNARKAARLLVSEIRQRYGLALKIVDAVERKTPLDPLLTREAIVLGRGGQSVALSKERLPVPQKPEGYAIAVGPQQALVAGTDEAGVLWGVQTLIQLLAADAAGPLVRPAVIQDWPTLSVRAVHLFYGKDALPFQEKLIDRVLTRFKMNALFIQAEQVRWDTDPAVAPSWAGTKADLSKEIAFARDRGMTLYPLLESYGHMEWLFQKSGNVAFAEDPATPYAVNVTDPKAMGYLEKFNAEADSLFDAPGFHAGLDEVTMRGRFPYRSLPKTFPDLFVSNASYWHDFAAKRGKTLWLWADMALHPSEVSPCFGTAPSANDAAAVRAGLPKDIVMVDWQYSAHDSYPSLKILKKAGFQKLVAATWYYPEGIQNFSKAAARIGALGAMQTTWCGYESSESVLDTSDRRQFTAMVLAADYFWNGGAGPTPDKLPYDFAQVFAEQWRNKTVADYRSRTGSMVSFAPPSVTKDWTGYGAEAAFAGLPAGVTRLADGVRYRFPAPVGAAVPLQGRLNAPGSLVPRSATFPFGDSRKPGSVREVHLVLAASHQAAPGTKIGTLVFTAASGAATAVDLVYGKNIAAWNDAQSVAEAPVLVKGKSAGGVEARLRALTFYAPSKNEAPVSVTVTSGNTESAPIVFAITALN